MSLRRVVDLNLAVVAVPGHPAGEPRAGGRDEPGQVRVRAGDGASAAARVSPLRRALFRRAQGQVVLLSRSLSE